MRIAVALLLLMGGMVSNHQLPLEVLPDLLAICRLSPDTALPPWATVPAPFLTISRTSEELSITTSQAARPVRRPLRA